MLFIKLRPEIIPTNIFELIKSVLFYVGMIIVFIKCDHNVNYEMKWNEMKWFSSL